MNSLLDSNIELNDNQAAIVLFCNKNHALVGLEWEKNGTHEFRLMDFLPLPDGEDRVTLDLDSIIKNKEYRGRVRIQLYNLEGATRERVFTFFNLTSTFFTNYRVVGCTMAQADTLVALVSASQRTPPSFQISGNTRSGAIGHNCISWAESHLKAAGITVAANLLLQLSLDSINSSLDPILVRPETHTANSQCVIT